MKRRGLSAVLLLAAAVGLAGQSPTLRPGREVSLPPNEVKDTFFAYFLGIITAGLEMDIDREQMREILTEFKVHPDLPFELVSRVWQTTDAGDGCRRIGLEFTGAVDVPVPFSLLFYHPGSIRADQFLLFTVHCSTYADPSDQSVMSPVYDLELSSGSLFADIDQWLEVLFSASLEDTWIRHAVFFTRDGEWIALLEGTAARSGRNMRAYFNLTRNRIVFPVPAAVERAGKMILP